MKLIANGLHWFWRVSAVALGLGCAWWITQPMFRTATSSFEFSTSRPQDMGRHVETSKHDVSWESAENQVSEAVAQSVVAPSQADLLPQIARMLGNEMEIVYGDEVPTSVLGSLAQAGDRDAQLALLSRRDPLSEEFRSHLDTAVVGLVAAGETNALLSAARNVTFRPDADFRAEWIYLTALESLVVNDQVRALARQDKQASELHAALRGQPIDVVSASAASKTLIERVGTHGGRIND